MKKYKCLTGAALKNIALICMLLDHFNKSVMYVLLQREGYPLLSMASKILHILGRLAFPIFCFLLVQGFFHTRSRKKYMLNMVLFAFVSEIPYNLFFWGEPFCLGVQNIFFALALALGVMWAIDKIRKKTKLWAVLGVVIVGVACAVAEIMHFDYGYIGILCPLAFYIFSKTPFIASIVSYMVVFNRIYCLPSFLITNLYNGQRGKQNKWFNYWFYPIHLLVLVVIRDIMILKLI